MWECEEGRMNEERSTDFNITVNPEGEVLMLEVGSNDPDELPPRKPVMQCRCDGSYELLPEAEYRLKVKLFRKLIDGGVIEISGRETKKYSQFQEALRNFLVYECVRPAAAGKIQDMIKRIADPLILLQVAKLLDILIPEDTVGSQNDFITRLVIPYVISQLEKGLDLLNGKPVTCQELLPLS